MRIVSLTFISYILVLTSGILYNYFFKNQLIWPLVFSFILFLTLFVMKNKIPKIQINYIKYSVVFLILFFFFGYVAKAINFESAKEGDFFIDLIKSFSAMVVTPLFIFKYVTDFKSKNYLINIFIVFGVLNLVFQLFIYFNPELFLELINRSDLTVENLGSSFRVAGFFSNPNIAAVYYLFLYILIQKHKIRYPNLLRLIIVMGILLTLSRSATIALLLMFVFEIITNKNLLLRILLFLSLIMILFISLNYFSEIEQFERMVIDNSIIRDSRFDLWEYSLFKIFETSSILGLGIFEMDNIIYWKGRAGVGPHNLFIYIYGSSGIFSLFFFIYFCIFQCKKYLKEKTDYFFIIFMMTGFMFNHDLIKSAVFWMLLSFLFVLKTVKFKNEDITGY